MQVSLLHCQYCQKLLRQGRSIFHKLFFFKVQGQLLLSNIVNSTLSTLIAWFPNTSTIEHIFFENGTTMVDKCIKQMYIYDSQNLKQERTRLCW